MTDIGQTQLKTQGVLTVAIVSDLHAYDTCDEKKPSFYCIQDDIADTPVGALFRLIEEESLSADVLLCGGDLGDKAHPAAIRAAWTRVHEIGAKLKVEMVAGTVGNHDIDSRYQHNDHDPKGHLQQLNPAFPLPSEDSNDRFWSRNYEILVSDVYRLVVLNTCAFHGGGSDELHHGRLSRYTLDAIAARLQSTPIRPVNILLCHHHPQKHMELDLGEYDEMRSGQLLVELLGSGHYGDWIIVHGHKHHPKICYAHGSSTAPVIFSAGSLCHVLFPELATVAQRQFYLLQFPIARYSDLGFAGTFRAWDWEFKSGWGKPTRKSGLPAQGGFGHKTNLRLLAGGIFRWINGRVVPWSEFIAQFPTFEFLLPQDAAITLKTLNDEHQINVHYENDIPVNIGAAP